ncbi:uncharacterized protein [Montipora foliosa]|uniref:uncharacterized protein n=1 Tax=Montipora foliosa TaxID=591990 RepID=UPI0035F17B8B
MSRAAKSKKVKSTEISSGSDISFTVEAVSKNKDFATGIDQDKILPEHSLLSADYNFSVFAENEALSEKHENAVSESSTGSQSSKKRPASPLIAYIESMSPLKRSKSGSVEYFNLKLQSACGTQPAVCFSRLKRSFFDDRVRTKTAVKIERYNTAKDGRTIFINDMTKLSSPATSEYNFQFSEGHDTNYLSLQSMLDNAVDMDMVDVIGKLVYKDNEIESVGASKLKKTNCYIADETASIKLILWESKIEEVKVEEVYTFKQVRLRRDGYTAHLNTTVDTVIERKVDHNLKKNLVVENITPEKDIADLEMKRVKGMVPVLSVMVK